MENSGSCFKFTITNGFYTSSLMVHVELTEKVKIRKIRTNFKYNQNYLHQEEYNKEVPRIGCISVSGLHHQMKVKSL
ncbi:12927_t:CDS:2 [Funneliformis mosseae]|uniref:12927_t:CDS:1 n=1 Tax=Funneliformis mosseae TaxID=27381 RepID=A0A9N9FM30_FUNMO|nr:12927_t:CDS:2 [Funneliformis mosseae]